MKWRAWAAGMGVRSAIAAILAGVLMLGRGPLVDPGAWYGCDWHVPVQASRLLSGHLSLSDFPGDLRFDLTWTRDGVQQVWGLGLSAWHALWALLLAGGDALRLPSRLPLAVAMVVYCSVVLGTAWKVALATQVESRVQPMVASVLSAPFLLQPAVRVLFQSPFLVYEETVLYGQLYAGVMVCVYVRQVLKPSLGGLVLLSVMAGLGPHIRPTVGAYSAALLVMAMTAWRPDSPPSSGTRRYGLALTCAAIPAVTGLVVLCWTNQLRFGSPLEFGHRFNVSHHHAILDFTRFERVPPMVISQAVGGVREVLGGLVSDFGFGLRAWDSPDVFLGQSSLSRFREHYLPALGWGAVAFPLAAALLPAVVWPSGQPPGIQALLRGGGMAAFLSFGMLAVFYAVAPVLSSRYLYDFSTAESLGCTAVVLWCVVMGARHGRTLVALALACLLPAGVVRPFQDVFTNYGGPGSNDWHGFSELLRREAPIWVSRKLGLERPEWDLAGCYSNRRRRFDEDRSLLVPYDGFGWDSTSGAVARVTSHFVYDTRHLEFSGVLAGGPDIEGRPATAPELLVADGRATVNAVEIDGEAITVRATLDGRGGPNQWDVVFVRWPVDWMDRGGREGFRLREVRWNR